MSGPALDRAAWSSRWRTRSVADKALLSLGLVACAVAAPGWSQAVIVLAVAMTIALAWARVPGRLLVRAMAAPAVFIAISVVSIALAIGTPPATGVLWRWGPLSISHASLLLAATVAGRAFAGMAALMLLACTTPMIDILTALRRARVPDPLIEIASLTYRLLFVLAAVTESVRASQAGRLGHDGWRRSWRSTGLLTSAVLLRSWDRARRLEDGLAGRGFSGSLRTLAPTHPRSTAFEIAAIIVLIVCAAVVAAPGWGWKPW